MIILAIWKNYFKSLHVVAVSYALYETSQIPYWYFNLKLQIGKPRALSSANLALH